MIDGRIRLGMYVPLLRGANITESAKKTVSSSTDSKSNFRCESSIGDAELRNNNISFLTENNSLSFLLIGFCIHIHVHFLWVNN